MLLLERRRLDVAALGWRGPDAALSCFARDFPMRFRMARPSQLEICSP